MERLFSCRRFFNAALMFSLVLVFLPARSESRDRVRNEIRIPDIEGYVTLKCDFHMHTVFSDGRVWPTIRVEEAWREGLDVIAVTDHIEYQPHRNDIPTNHGRPYEIAEPAAESLGLILVKGAEITRDTPPGHHNALFVAELDSLDTENFYDSVKAAVAQGGFVFYNHPGWKHPERKAEWFPFQTELYENGWLHGVEVVNGKDYYPLAHQWCLDKKLTMFGNSDIHNPISHDYDLERGEHRPITLVFAKKRTKKAVKDALFARRTAVWWNNCLIGEEKYLRPLFNESIEIVNPNVTITGNGSANVQIRNMSDVDFELVAGGEPEYVTAPRELVLHAGKTVLLPIRKRPPEMDARGKKIEVYGRKRIRIPYTVRNLLVAPGTGLSEEIPVSVKFVKAEESR